MLNRLPRLNIGAESMKTLLASCSLCLVLALSGCADTGRSRDHSDGYRGRDNYDNDGPRSVSAVHGYLDSRAKSEKRLADTEEALHLTPKQQVFWDAYQAKVSAFVADQTRVDLNTPEKNGALNKINAKIDQARDRLAALEEIGEAAKVLYSSLDDEQKVIADQRLSETIPGNFPVVEYSSDQNNKSDSTQWSRHRSGSARSGDSQNGSNENGL
jgi:LTXXQ motif family protein